jgi:hypothetical protein
MNNKLEILLDTLLSSNYKAIIDEYGKAVIPSSTIYQEISNKINYILKPKYIYVLLQSNRHKILDKILEFHGIEKVTSEVLSDNDDSLNISNNDYEFNICLNFKTWVAIKPEKNDSVLQRTVWSHKLYQEVYKETKLPCAFSFKRAKLSETGTYLTVYGKCYECSSSFLGCVYNKPQFEANVIMECTVKNFNSTILHKKNVS